MQGPLIRAAERRDIDHASVYHMALSQCYLSAILFTNYGWSIRAYPNNLLQLGGMSEQQTKKRSRQRTPNNRTTTGFRISDELQRHNMKLVRSTPQSIIVERPEPTEEQPQGMHLDKGYDYDEVYAI